MTDRKSKNYTYKAAANYELGPRARGCVAFAVKCGKLAVKTACEDCGASGRLHGHHEDYAKPLDVVWLCKQCHLVRHYPPGRTSAQVSVSMPGHLIDAIGNQAQKDGMNFSSVVRSVLANHFMVPNA